MASHSGFTFHRAHTTATSQVHSTSVTCLALDWKVSFVKPEILSVLLITVFLTPRVVPAHGRCSVSTCAMGGCCWCFPCLQWGRCQPRLMGARCLFMEKPSESAAPSPADLSPYRTPRTDLTLRHKEPLRHGVCLRPLRCAVHRSVHACTAVLSAPKWVPCLTHPSVPRAWHPVYVC